MSRSREAQAARFHRLQGAGRDRPLVLPNAWDAMSARVVEAVDAPLNVMARRGAPAVPERGRLAVARVSVGPAIALSFMAHVRRAAAELLDSGGYVALADAMAFAEANALFARPAPQSAAPTSAGSSSAAHSA